jgi:PAS domain S-box-containing protein
MRVSPRPVWAGRPEFTPTISNGILRLFASALQQACPLRMRYGSVAPNGEFRWFVVAAEPFRDKQGRILKWYGIGTDIQDRKRAEEVLRAAEHEARELLERVPALISLRTVAGIAYTNQRIHNYIGVGQEELRGQGWLKYIHPEDRERTLANQTRSTEEVETMDHLYRLRGADGAYRWFRTIAEPYPEYF